MKYRKKPVEIEAIQITEELAWKYLEPKDIKRKFPWGLVLSASWHPERREIYSFYVGIKTLEGNMRAEIGDWIIRGVKGELYPCKPDVFAATYDPVEEPPQVVQPTDPVITSNGVCSYCGCTSASAWDCSMSFCPFRISPKASQTVEEPTHSDTAHHAGNSGTGVGQKSLPPVEPFSEVELKIQSAVAQERERCARIVGELEPMNYARTDIAAAIRRGE